LGKNVDEKSHHHPYYSLAQYLQKASVGEPKALKSAGFQESTGIAYGLDH